ncbi:MAG: hypothetical protein Q7S75_00765 [bacterium]|nr:hypothetical protein [bacterium]
MSTQRIAHYYGEPIRILFVMTAALIVIAVPVTGNLLPFGTFFEVASAIVLVMLAGFIHPHGRWTIMLNVIVSAIGVLLLETAAVSFYQSDSFWLFLIREISAIMLLFALYFSIKTLRSMALHKIGKPDSLREFDEEE